MAGGQCTGLQSRPPAFLDSTSVAVEELPRLVPSFEAALQAPRALCCALHHFRVHLTRWQPMV
jgi:hypothetical protein